MALFHLAALVLACPITNSGSISTISPPPNSFADEIPAGSFFSRRLDASLVPEDGMNYKQLNEDEEAQVPPAPVPSGAAMAAGPSPGFTIAHIASPLIRQNLPGQAPFPLARARAAMTLFQLALERASAEGVDAIAVTGSVISAPPPLRQCDKGGYYKHPDAAAALEEAQADYLAVRTLLEETGVPYAVTPGSEDCIEAFELIFGLEPSATLLRWRNGVCVR